MYSGNHKFGRGGGGGATKRKVFGAPPPQRLSSSSSSGRLSLGGSRNPASSSAPASVAASSEETFSLVGGNPLSFAAIIRLAPDLVEEIKRVEAEGGAAKIKFDSNPNNSLGNVIDVGGKEFRFTWSRETGDLCDIYEERQNDEDGNGLLVESGCAWRKLNVQRVLDESAKNHVKRLSEEAERQFKSRKAKFLDPSNASMKSQMKALAAAEASPWKFKHKKDYFKKRSFEPPQVGGPPMAAHKSGLPTTGAAKGRYSASPVPSPQNQSVSLASPSMKGNATENQAITDGTTHIQPRKKENTLGVEKDLTSRSSDGLQESVACRDNQVEGAKDVQNLLITLLKENPKGMNMKTLEKAVADRSSNSARKIEPLLEKIATFRPPGIYVLKTAVELGSQKRSSSDVGSSPGDSQQKHYILEDNLESASASVFAIKSPPEDLEERGPMDESNLVEKIDPSQHFSDLFGDDEPPENSEGQAASSRGTGSDSDSDSSDSGSESGSRSRSRSPAETANGSGSDSENDSSSNSKDGSDVEIDILNDDDKEPKKLHDAEQGLSRATVPWSMPDAEPLQNGNLRDQEGFASEDIDIDKDFLGDNEAELASVSRAPAVPTENLKTVSPEHRQSRVYGVTDMYNESDDVDEELKHEQPDSLMMFKGKSKRGSDASQFEENSEHFKRLKSGSMAQSSMSGYMGSISPRSSPDITNEYHQDNHNLQVSDSYDRTDNSNLGGQRYNHPVPGKFSPDLLQSGPRPPIRSHDIETADKFGKIPRSRGLDVKHQEANAYKREGFLKQGDKGRKGTRDGESTLNENTNVKFKGGAFDKKLDMRAEPQYEKHGEEGKKSLTMGNSSRLQAGSSPKDGGQAGFDRASVDNRRLQRELSDLELGELREPLPEEHEVMKKQFERVGSFKQSDTKSSTSGSQNADLRGRPAGKPTIDTASPSLPTSRGGGLKNMNNWSKRSPEPSAEDTSRPCHQTSQSQQQQPRVSHTEVGYVLSKAADVNRLRPNEGAVNEETDVEGYGESQKKSHAQLEESKQDPHSRKVKGSRSLKSNAWTDASDRRKDASSTEGRNDKRKRSGSSLDEDVSYSKYEKEEPELKGPIKNFSQYSEYVQDYCEKYESYCSLNTILESYRSEFQKLGTDLESAKDRDMERYYNILAQLRESYRQCGMRHKRLKKIFIVLHEELKHLKQRIKEFAVEYMRD